MADTSWYGEKFADSLEEGAKLRRLTPPNAELLELAERYPAPQEWYDEHEF